MRGATGCCCESRIRVWISIHAPHARSDGCSGHPHHTLQSISIHAPHARSDLGYKRTMRHAGISIHAPHARSDRCRFLARLFSCNFNPRSSCEERPVAVDVLAACRGISIHAPHARSDLGRQKARSIASNFNPRSSCEERPSKSKSRTGGSDFNPRSSCEERLSSPFTKPKIVAFQSTLLMRGATRGFCISVQGRSNFNPRSSCEERPQFAACALL